MAIEHRLTLSRPAIAGIAGTFLLMGMIGAAYGPLLEHLASRFSLTLPIAGAAISVHFSGALVGTLVSMWTMTKVSGRASVVAPTAVLAAGCVTVAVAPRWEPFLLGVSVLGLGWGSLVIALNQLVAFSEGARRSALLNALNGAYSAGAVAAPVLVSTYAASHFWWLYGGAALLALLLIPFASGVSGRLELRRPVGSGRNRALIVTFVVAFVAYVAVEAGTAGWMTSHLESTGLLSRDAALLTSGFFLALVAGRLLITLTPDRVPERAIVLTCSSLAVGTLLVAASGRFAPEAYIATGLVIAPIFPTAIVWLAKANPGDPSAT
ncbi:MAG TPA: MFS transporter, partial [Candidatus Dormibacteraeota bacterium]|nr:MFS transporter [Candidatus Dormibacteraeota bacterium]